MDKPGKAWRTPFMPRDTARSMPEVVPRCGICQYWLRAPKLCTLDGDPARSPETGAHDAACPRFALIGRFIDH